MYANNQNPEENHEAVLNDALALIENESPEVRFRRVDGTYASRYTTQYFRVEQLCSDFIEDRRQTAIQEGRFSNLYMRSVHAVSDSQKFNLRAAIGVDLISVMKPSLIDRRGAWIRADRASVFLTCAEGVTDYLYTSGVVSKFCAKAVPGVETVLNIGMAAYRFNDGQSWLRIGGSLATAAGSFFGGPFFDGAIHTYNYSATFIGFASSNVNLDTDIKDCKFNHIDDAYTLLGMSRYYPHPLTRPEVEHIVEIINDCYRIYHAKLEASPAPSKLKDDIYKIPPTDVNIGLHMAKEMIFADKGI